MLWDVKLSVPKDNAAASVEEVAERVEESDDLED